MKLGENDIKLYLGSAEVAKVYLGTTQVYPSEEPTPVPYDEQYLTIESTSDNNTIYWKKRASNKQGKTISASTDDGSTWIEYTSTSGNGMSIATLNSGETIIFKGENATYFESSNPQGIFASTSSFITYGNIMSLVYGDNFSGQTTLTSGNTFSGLFSQCSGLTSVENLILPATTLADGCYSQMFISCTNLTTAPELPADTLANSCYNSMFSNCTSLTAAPELPATTLASRCYSQMFDGCTSLTTAPELPATTLSDWCYYYMFSNCTSLTTAPELPATTLANYCYLYMFLGCTSLTTAPELPATTLAQYCYSYMFQGCTSLNSITCLATDISANSCTTNWVKGVAASGSFFVPSGNPASWKCGVDGVPSNWTIEDTNGDTYECTGGKPSTDVPLDNCFAVKVNGVWNQSMDYISDFSEIESYLGDMGIDSSDVEELAIGNMTGNINLDGENWDSCTGLTLAQSVTHTSDIHNFPAMQWVNVMANNLEYMGISSLFSDMNCCPIYVPEVYLSEYQMNWESQTTNDCDGTVADRLVAYIGPNA